MSYLAVKDLKRSREVWARLAEERELIITKDETMRQYCEFAVWDRGLSPLCPPVLLPRAQLLRPLPAACGEYSLGAPTRQESPLTPRRTPDPAHSPCTVHTTASASPRDRLISTSVPGVISVPA